MDILVNSASIIGAHTLMLGFFGDSLAAKENEV